MHSRGRFGSRVFDGDLSERNPTMLGKVQAISDRRFWRR